MKNIFKVLLNHSILILSILSMLFVGWLFSSAEGDAEKETFLTMFLIPYFMFMFIFPIPYAVFFFRRENFLTPILPLLLGYFDFSPFGVFPKFNFGILIFSLSARMIVFILVLIFREKLKKWSGEERVTSDIVFFVKVLCRKFCNAIT